MPSNPIESNPNERSIDENRSIESINRSMKGAAGPLEKGFGNKCISNADNCEFMSRLFRLYFFSGRFRSLAGRVRHCSAFGRFWSSAVVFGLRRSLSAVSVVGGPQGVWGLRGSGGSFFFEISSVGASFSDVFARFGGGGGRAAARVFRTSFAFSELRGRIRSMIRMHLALS